MKIVIILFELKGGMVHYTSQLSNALSKNNELIVFGSSKIKHYFKPEINYVPLSIPYSHFNIRKLISIYLQISKKINIIKPDVIHFPAIHIYTLLLLPFLREENIFFTIHDPLPHSGKSFSIINFIQYMYIKRGNGIIVHSKKFLNLGILKKIVNEKKFVLPHGAFSFLKDINDSKTIMSEKLNHQELLYFGRISKYKGLDYLIKAFSIVKNELPNVKLTIAGSGDIKPYNKMIHGTDSIEVINEFIPDEEIPMLFNKADIVVLPYIDSTQSGIPHIAYAFKKPVIATNTGALSDIVLDGKTGLIVPPKDYKTLAISIIKLLKDYDLRHQMGENALKLIENEMSWDSIANDTVQAYKQIICE